MLPIEEVGSVSRIQLHGLKPLPPLQRRACPFPHSARFTSSGKSVAVLGDGRWVEMLETDVAAFEVGEVRRRVELVLGARGAMVARVRWRRDLNTVVGEVPVEVSVISLQSMLSIGKTEYSRTHSLLRSCGLECCLCPCSYWHRQNYR